MSTTPDQMVLEFTAEPGCAADIAAWRGNTAHETLARWVAGDRTPNNDLR